MLFCVYCCFGVPCTSQLFKEKLLFNCSQEKSSDWASTIPSNVVANPVRRLLDRERSEDHLQSSNESIKTKQKERNNNTKHMSEKDKRALDREFGIVPAASHPIPSPDRNHAPKRIASTTLRTLRVSGFSNGTVDVAYAVHGLVQSTRLESASRLLQSPQVQPQPCPPLSLLSFSAGVRTPFPLRSPTRP